MQLIINFIPWPKTCQKPYAKTSQKPNKNPWQKLAKNPMRTKNLFGSAKNFYDNINIKILNNTKNFLILPNKQKPIYEFRINHRQV